MAETFFIGDTHLGHANIIKFEPVLRPFATIDDHDEHLIIEWNRVVRPGDKVYHLGDVAFRNFPIERLAELNGHKHLVLGNHDQYPRLAPYFEDFYGARSWKDGILLTHVPINPGQLEHRFRLNFHGHTHSRSLADPRYVNLSVEQISLRPITYDEVRARL